MKKLNRFGIGLIWILLMIVNNKLQADQGSMLSIFDKMNYTETIDITLEMDMKALTADMRSTDKHKAILSFIDQNGVDQVWNAKVNIRGKFRRMNCDEMPPLKLNFSKADLKAAGLNTFDDLKVVTHCIENKAIAKELLLKEYLAYKLYNQITDESLRVQFIKITYQDIKSRKKKKQWAFIIEDTAQLRVRLEAKKCKNQIGLTPDQFNRNQINTAALFQYMIGNADWSLRMGRNMKMILKDDQVLAIPYDFDFSGLVNAPYAVANSNVGQKKVKERIYLGLETDRKNLQSSINLFSEKKEVILDYIKNFKALRPCSRKSVLKYVESFFENTDDIYFVREAIAAQDPHLEQTR